MGKRLVVLPWTCDRSGDCCRTGEVVMTPQEAEAIREVADKDKFNSTRWRAVPGGYVALLGSPCPFLVALPDNTTACGVWSHRPYNCRRFACLRPDASAEPWEGDGMNLGCANLRERIEQDRGARRFMANMQRKAQRWARAHGWKGV